MFYRLFMRKRQNMKRLPKELQGCILSFTRRCYMCHKQWIGTDVHHCLNGKYACKSCLVHFALFVLNNKNKCQILLI